LKSDLRAEFRNGGPAQKFSDYLYLSGDYALKDFYQDAQYSFGYGQKIDGSMVLFGWKTTRSNTPLNLRELTDIYLDELFAVIENKAELKRWKQIRKALVSAFIDLRTGKGSFMILPMKKKNQQAFINFGEADELGISYNPLVVRFVRRDDSLMVDSETEDVSSSRDKKKQQ
jgi:hypothetical protein